MQSVVCEELNFSKKKQFRKTAVLCGTALILHMALTYLLQILGSFVLRLCRIEIPWINREDANLFVMLFGVCSAFYITFFVVLKNKFSPLFKTGMHIEKGTGMAIIAALPVMITGCIVSVKLLGVFSKIGDVFGIGYDTNSLFERDYTSVGKVAELCYACVIAPAVEELIFRGFVLGNLKDYGTRTAIFASAIIFAIMHGNFSQMPNAFWAGVVLGTVAVYTRGLIAPVLIHMVYNAIISYASYINSLYGIFCYEIMFLFLGVAGAVVLLVNRKKIEAVQNEVPADVGKLRVFFTAWTVIIFILGNLLGASLYITLK